MGIIINNYILNLPRGIKEIGKIFELKFSKATPIIILLNSLNTALLKSHHPMIQAIPAETMTAETMTAAEAQEEDFWTMADR